MHSRPLILDPIAHHPRELRSIWNNNLRGTLKELAQLDGAFIFDETGVLVAGCRYLDAKASDIEMPMGLGSRHLTGASISKVTAAIAIVVSESAVVRIFEGGTLIGDIIPELWLLSQEHVFGKPLKKRRPANDKSKDVRLCRTLAKWSKRSRHLMRFGNREYRRTAF